MHPLRRAAVLIIAASCLVGASGPSSGAAFGSTQSICAGPAAVTALSSGAAWGAAACDGGIRVVSRQPGGTWRRSAVLYRGYGLLSATDDGTWTYVTLVDPRDYSPAGHDAYIGKVDRAGRPSALTLLTSDEARPDSSVVARSGGWWSFTTSTDRGIDRNDPYTRLFWRKTLGGAARGEIPLQGRGIFEPRAALTAAGVVVAFARQHELDGRLTLSVASASATSPHFTERSLGPVDARALDIAHSGGRTGVVWLRDGRPHLQFLDTPSAVSFATRGQVNAIAVAMSGGHAFVATAETFPSAGGTTTRVYLRDFSERGLVTTELSAEAGRTNPTLKWGLSDLTAARGLATAVVGIGGGTASISQR